MFEDNGGDAYEEDLLQHLSDTIKQLQITQLQNNVKYQPIGNDSKVANLLCTSLELILWHGLKSRTNGIWSVVKVYCTKSDLTLINSFQRVKTNVGKGRVWIYLALNDGLLESYIRSLSSDTSHLKLYYNKNAFLLSNKVEIFCTLISGLENFKFQFNPNVIYLDFDFVRPKTTVSSPQYNNKPLKRVEPGSTVTFDIRAATNIASKQTLKATNLLRSVFEKSAAPCCSICQGELICLCPGTTAVGSGSTNVSELPDLVPFHENFHIIDQVNSSIVTSSSYEYAVPGDNATVTTSSSIDNKKVNSKCNDNIGTTSNDHETMDGDSTISTSSHRVNPFNTMMDEDAPTVKTKWEEMSVQYYDSPLEVIRNKQVKIYKKKKTKTKRVKSKTSSSSEFESTCTESEDSLARKSSTSEKVNCDIESNVEEISPVTDTTTQSDGQSSEVPTLTCINAAEAQSIDIKELDGRCNVDEVSDPKSLDNEEIDANVASEFEDDTIQISNLDLTITTNEDGEVCECVTAVIDDGMDAVMEEDVEEGYSVDIPDETAGPEDNEYAEELIDEDLSVNFKITTDKDDMDEEVLVINENHFSIEEDSVKTEEQTKVETGLKDVIGETEQEDIADDFNENIEIFHKRKVVIDNTTKLFLMLEILQHEDETILQLFETCSGHSEGDWQCMFLLFTDYNMYCMTSGDGNALYKVNNQISFNQIDHILIDINYQALNICYYENETGTKSKHSGMKSNIRVETGDSALTRCILNAFHHAFAKFSIRHDSVKVTPTLFHDTDYHRVILKKYIQNETKCLLQDAKINFYNFIHWADSDSATCKSPRQELAGYLQYKSASSIIFGDVWKEAYFVLCGSTLLQYTDKQQEKPNLAYDVGSSNCYGCKRSKAKNASETQFEVIFSSGNNLQMRASDNEKVTSWTQALCLAVATDQMSQLTPTEAENNDYDDLIPCVMMISNDHLLIFHEDHTTAFCRTLAKCHLKQITTIATEETEHLICQFTIQISSDKSNKWTVYFSTKEPVKQLPSLICNLQKDQVLPTLTVLDPTVKLQQGLVMLGNKWTRSDKLLKGRIKEAIPWGTT